VYASVPQTNNAASVVERVLALVSSGRAGLVTDIDGTISPIVGRPEEAYVLPTAREALARLRGLIALVAVVTGRSVADARKMVDVDGLTYVGNYGLEVWRDGRPWLVPEVRPWVPRLARVLEQIQNEYRDPDVLVENKGATASLHYRLVADPDRTRRELLALLARRAITSGLRVEEGRMVINLLPPLTVTKGSAVTWLAREHRLERLVYLGDDTTDAHAFRALAVLRQNAEVRTLGIGVIAADTPPSVRRLADTCVQSVAEVADLLCRTVEGLQSGASMEPGANSDGRDSHGQRRAVD
jgi:trehalose 6-phosphate phosphatase